MCECGCNQVDPDIAWRMPDGNVLALQIYPGCENCFRGVGVQLYFFDKEGERQWLEGVDIQELPKADEYGGNNGVGVAIPCIDIEKLILNAQAIAPEADAIGEYESTADYFEDNLFPMIRKNSVEVVGEWRKEQQ